MSLNDKSYDTGLGNYKEKDNVLQVEAVKEAVEELDEYFEQGFKDKMNRFILYPTEWKELKQKIFGFLGRGEKK